MAPYQVHRVVTDVDATGWRPSRDELDRFGRPIPDEHYETKDFERIIALKARTQAVARHLTDFMRRTDRWAKTIVFCVDDGIQLRVIQYTDYTAAQIRTLFRTPDALAADWADPVKREAILDQLNRRGIAFSRLAEAAGHADADPLDLLCHLAFQRPLRTRRQRAEHLRKNQPDFFDQFSAVARGILDALLDQYTEHGPDEFRIPHALQVPPIAVHGNPMEIADLFGGPVAMRQAVNRLQSLLYAEIGDR